MKKLILFLLFCPLAAWAQSIDELDSLAHELDGIEVRAAKRTVSRLAGPQQGFVLNKDELFRAACCNLGESFQNNPSVDVNYSDAATGAKQIKLLGLDGKYVHMLTEGQGNFYGGARPFALSYVPGPWMNSISVSKGASSVKQGYEGIAGHINVEYLQPEAEEGLTFNLYGDIENRYEINADGNLHIGKNWATNVLVHFDKRYGYHDKNGDTFMDAPNAKQFNAFNRWYGRSGRYIFHGGFGVLHEERHFGQNHHTASQIQDQDQWRGWLNTNRLECYTKHAFVLNEEKGMNIAIMANVADHDQDQYYGPRSLRMNQIDMALSAIFESNFGDMHHVSVGLNNDGHVLLQRDEEWINDYGTYGGYAQYTFNLNNKLIAMAGLRADNDGERTFITPRLHVKYQLADFMQLRASAGKGYKRTELFWAENAHLMATGRKIACEKNNPMEEAWNFGASMGFDIPIFGKNLKLNAEYFYTTFQNQLIVDYDNDVEWLRVYSMKDYAAKGNATSKPRSFSHVLQMDAQYELFPGFDATIAFRRNIVKTTTGGELRDKALQSKYKGLFSFSYKPGIGLWQIDGSLQLNGPARLPLSAISSGSEYTPVYPQLTMQVTRWFRNFSLYVGGENLTNYKQPIAVIGADKPFSTSFDATQSWAPTMGRMVYAGLRVNIGRM